jgi:hypothetical protein
MLVSRQVTGEVVVADRDVAGVGAGIAEPDRGPFQVRRRPRPPGRVLQVGAGAQHRGEVGGVVVVLEDLLALAQQPGRLL